MAHDTSHNRRSQTCRHEKAWAFATGLSVWLSSMRPRRLCRASGRCSAWLARRPERLHHVRSCLESGKVAARVVLRGLPIGQQILRGRECRLRMRRMPEVIPMTGAHTSHGLRQRVPDTPCQGRFERNPAPIDLSSWRGGRETGAGQPGPAPCVRMSLGRMLRSLLPRCFISTTYLFFGHRTCPTASPLLTAVVKRHRVSHPR